MRIYDLHKTIKRLKGIIYTERVKKSCRQYGRNLGVNGKSAVTGNTIIKNNVNFNGLTIRGGGQCGNRELLSFRRRLSDDNPKS